MNNVSFTSMHVKRVRVVSLYDISCRSITLDHFKQPMPPLSTSLKAGLIWTQTRPVKPTQANKCLLTSTFQNVSTRVKVEFEVVTQTRQTFVRGLLKSEHPITFPILLLQGSVCRRARQLPTILKSHSEAIYVCYWFTLC